MYKLTFNKLTRKLAIYEIESGEKGLNPKLDEIVKDGENYAIFTKNVKNLRHNSELVVKLLEVENVENALVKDQTIEIESNELFQLSLINVLKLMNVDFNKLYEDDIEACKVAESEILSYIKENVYEKIMNFVKKNQRSLIGEPDSYSIYDSKELVSKIDQTKDENATILLTPNPSESQFWKFYSKLNSDIGL
jgi:hypothetical protein